MENEELKETALALKSEWDLEIPDALTEEAILELLAARLVKIIERGPDTFYQLMYRLDISEKKLNAVLQDKNVPLKIAKLIYDRQLQKIQSRLNYRKEKESGDPDLKW